MNLRKEKKTQLPADQYMRSLLQSSRSRSGNMLSPVLIIVTLIPAWVSCRLVNNNLAEYSNEFASEYFTQTSSAYNYDDGESEMEKTIVSDQTVVEDQVTNRVTTHERPMISVCCEPYKYLQGSRCNANVTFLAKKILAPEVSSVPEVVEILWGIPCRNGETYTLNARPQDYPANEVYYLLGDGKIFADNPPNPLQVLPGDSFGLSHDSHCFIGVKTNNATINSIAVCLPPIGRFKVIPIIGLTLLLLVVTFFLYNTYRRHRFSRRKVVSGKVSLNK